MALLLAGEMDPILVGVSAGVAGVLLLVALIYGIVRKFTRLTWIGWQVFALFGLVLLLDFCLSFLPEGLEQWVYFVIWAGGFTACTMLVLGVGGLVRWAIFRRTKKAALFWRVLDRILGPITAILTIVALLLVLGGAAVSVLDEALGLGTYVSALPAPVSALYAFFLGHGYDIFLCGMYLIVMRAGYRLGLLKSIFYITMFALTTVSVAGAVFLAVRVDFGIRFSLWLGSLFPLHEAAGATIGYGIVSLLFFLVFFTISMLIGKFLNFLIVKINSVRVIGFIDGLLVSILFSAIFIGCICGVNYVAFLAEEGYLGEMLSHLFSSLPEQIQGISSAIYSVLDQISYYIVLIVRSAPLGRNLYESNPLALLMG